MTERTPNISDRVTRRAAAARVEPDPYAATNQAAEQIKNGPPGPVARRTRRTR